MKRLLMSMAVFASVCTIALADGNAFTPLNFNDTTYPGNAPAARVTTTSASQLEEATGNGNIQNAILQLDNAQVDIRNDLLNCKTKFADVDAQYKLVKTERKALKTQIKTVEKRIKEIDKAKEKIRKNML